MSISCNNAQRTHFRHSLGRYLRSCFVAILGLHSSLASADILEDLNKPEVLRMVAYNIYMRPTSLFLNGQSIRANLIPGRTNQNDVLILSEASDDEVRAQLLQNLRVEYPYSTPVVGTDRGVEQDGGVIIVSRWPIEDFDSRRFQSTCNGSDCMADKGVAYARINKLGQRYHVFGTHTQAWPTLESARTRQQQFNIIRQFVVDKQISHTDPVLIGGDLNVDMRGNPSEHSAMLTLLNASQPRVVGDYTYDPRTNDLASGEKGEFLDYILFSKTHRQPTAAVMQVMHMKSSECWKEFFWESCHYDLSDHHAIGARYEFGRIIATPTVRPDPSPSPAPNPAPEDCISYDPNRLSVADAGAPGWRLQAGDMWMSIFDNQRDAENALAVVRKYSQQCFIGRGNSRPNRKDYIVQYWQTPSGISSNVSESDCLPYLTNNLSIQNEGASGWRLTDGSSRMKILDNESDARAMLALAQRNSQHCFIGRGNARPDRMNYVFEYWQ